MDIIVHGRNVEVNDWIREYVEKKVGKLERYLSGVTDVRAELTHTPYTRGVGPLHCADHHVGGRSDPASRGINQRHLCIHRRHRRQDLQPDPALQRAGATTANGAPPRPPLPKPNSPP
jgi:ribosomal subunit interface protein